MDRWSPKYWTFQNTYNILFEDLSGQVETFRQWSYYGLWNNNQKQLGLRQDFPQEVAPIENGFSSNPLRVSNTPYRIKSRCYVISCTNYYCMTYETYVFSFGFEKYVPVCNDAFLWINRQIDKKILTNNNRSIGQKLERQKKQPHKKTPYN